VFPAHQQRQVRVQLASVLRAVVTQFLLPTLSPPERVPAIEVLVINNAVAAMIRDDKCHQISSQIQTGRDAGMIPLERSLAALVKSRRIAFDTAAAVLPDDGELRRMLGR
jgi:twitching motility protein PilT